MMAPCISWTDGLQTGELNSPSAWMFGSRTGFLQSVQVSLAGQGCESCDVIVREMLLPPPAFKTKGRLNAPTQWALRSPASP